MSRCEGFPTFWELTTTHTEDGDGVSYQNAKKPSHLDTAVCLRKFH